MYAITALSRIVRKDARIEVKVPAAQGRKAYSYFREGSEEETKTARSRKVAGIGGAIALGGLAAAAIALRQSQNNKSSNIISSKPSSGVESKSEASDKPDRVKSNRNTKIAASAIGGLVALRVAKDFRDRPKKEQSESSTLEKELGVASLDKDPEVTKSLGEGAFGSVSLTANGTAFKKIKLDNPHGLTSVREDELRLSHEAGEKGLGPKLLGIRREGKDAVGYEMEMLEGHETLASVLTKSRKDEGMTSDSFDSALIAVAKLHDAGIAHCDLNAFNLMQSKGETKIIDFGLSVKFKDPENLSEIELSRWRSDITKMEQTYIRNMRVKKTSPIQEILEKTSAMAGSSPSEAYKYYKEGMSKYV